MTLEQVTIGAVHAERVSHHQSTAEVTVESRLKYLEQSLEDRHSNSGFRRGLLLPRILGSKLAKTSRS